MLSRVKPLKFPKKLPQKRQLMKGSAGEQIYTTRLQGAHTLYVGVSSLVRTTLTSGVGWLEGDHPLNHIAVAILRIIYKRELGSSVEGLNQNLGQLAPPLHYAGVYDDKCRLRSVTFYMRQRLYQNQTDPNAPAAADFGKVIISPSFTLDTSDKSMKFGDLAARLGYQLQEWCCMSGSANGSTANENENWDRELYGYSATTVEGMHSTNLGENKAQMHSPIRRLDNRKLKLRMDTKILLSPTCYMPDPMAAIPGNDTNYVHQDAYVGKMYYFKDPYPVMDLHTVNMFDNNQDASYNSTEQAWNLKRIITDTNGDGIMRQNTDLVSTGLVHFPLDTDFKNLSKTGTFMCPNGGTRTINLVFDFYGPINKFFKGYKYMYQPHANLPNYPEVVGEMHGTCILFALKQHNPEGNLLINQPTNDPFYCGLNVKRRIYTVLGKEHHNGMDIHRWEINGVAETAIAKDAMNT